MCQYSADSAGPAMGRPNDWHLVHYGARARGGVGAVIVEATGVVPEGRISLHCLSLHDDSQIPAFARIADLIHAGGAKAFIQLVHSGRKGSAPAGWLEGTVPFPTPTSGGWETVAPSAIPFSEAYPTPRELTADEVALVPEAFAAAARRAIAAGFDGVQIHGAHGYLLHQFLSPASNGREDEWGGDLEGRTRLTREVVRAVRGAIGEGALMVRLSATDWTQEYPADGRPGWTLDDTAALAPLLVEDGADALNVSTGGNVADARIQGGPGYQVFAARAVREALTAAGVEDVPVAACGLIVAAEQAEQVLAGGAADIIEVGRPLLTDPMLPHAWRARLRCEAALPPQYQRGTARV